MVKGSRTQGHQSIDTRLKKEVYITATLVGHRDMVSKMLNEFKSMWGCPLRSKKPSKISHFAYVTQCPNKPLSTIGAGPKAREFEKAEINYIVAMKVIKTVQAEWATPIFFALKKDISLRLCVDHRKFTPP